MRRRLGARDRLHLVLDADTFSTWDLPIDVSGLSEQYVDELAAASARSGVDEAVLTGRGTIHGHAVAVIVGEFDFLGGTIGRATA